MKKQQQKKERTKPIQLSQRFCCVPAEVIEAEVPVSYVLKENEFVAFLVGEGFIFLGAHFIFY